MRMLFVFRILALIGVGATFTAMGVANHGIGGVRTKNFSFANADGTKLYGTYRTKGQKAPGILLIHMCNEGERENYSSLSKQLAEKGFIVLSFDYRGHGESKTASLDVKKDRDGFWSKENGGIYKDIKTAYKQLLSNREVTGPIGVVAPSCGVKRALWLAKTGPRIKALVLMSGNADEKGLEYLKSAKNVAVFGIAAEDDGDGIAAKWIREVGKASANPKKKEIIFKTGGHGTELFANHVHLESKIVGWFVAVLDAKASLR